MLLAVVYEQICKHMKIFADVRDKFSLNHHFSGVPFPIEVYTDYHGGRMFFPHPAKQKLTENAFKNTKHWIIPSIVSPVRQNVPLKCRLFLPKTVDNDACTIARRWFANCDDVARAFELVVIDLIRLSQIKWSKDSIINFTLNSFYLIGMILSKNVFLLNVILIICRIGWVKV